MKKCVLLAAALVVPLLMLSLTPGYFMGQISQPGSSAKETAWRLVSATLTTTDSPDYYEKTVFCYDQNEPSQIDSLEDWSYYNNLWLKGMRLKLYYDVNNEYVTRMEEGSTLYGLYIWWKKDFVYDNQHRLLMAYSTELNDESQLEVQHRVHFIYGTGTQFNMVEWNHDDLRAYYKKTNFDFDPQGRVAALTESVSPDSSLWTLTNRYQIEYTAQDGTTGAELMARITYGYPWIFLDYWQITDDFFNLLGLVSTVTWYSWQGTQWYIGYRYFYTYDANNNLLRRDYAWNDDNGGWHDPTERIVYSYDANNNKLTKTWDYYYDDIWHNWGYTDFSYEQYTANSDDTIPAVNELQLSVYPNPFRENLQISTWAKQSQPAKMEIYNLKGQLVKTYDSFTNLSVAWDGKNSRGTAVSNGIYYLKVSADGKSQTRKVILLK